MKGGCFGAGDELKKLLLGVVGSAFPACSFVQRLVVQIIWFGQVFFCKLYDYVLSSCNDGKELTSKWKRQNDIRYCDQLRLLISFDLMLRITIGNT